MEFTLFLGCNIPARVSQYEDSTNAVCRKLNIDLEELEQFNCCGYPMRNIDEKAFLLSAARNLALAEKKQKPMMVLCKCCYGSLTLARYHLKENPRLLEEINKKLSKEDLFYRGNLKIRHFLSVLHEDVGIKALKQEIKHKYKTSLPTLSVPNIWYLSENMAIKATKKHITQKVISIERKGTRVLPVAIFPIILPKVSL